MGYALMGFRKQTLTSQVSDLQYRLMTLTQRQQNLANAGSIMADGMVDQNEAKQMGFGTMSTLGKLGIRNVGAQFNEQGQEQLRANIHQQEKKIESEMKRLETQLKAKQAELESVKKSEDKCIKNSTPSYA